MPTKVQKGRKPLLLESTEVHHRASWRYGKLIFFVSLKWTSSVCKGKPEHRAIPCREEDVD
eukprot:100604-Amphidinium_carterae.1